MNRRQRVLTLAAMVLIPTCACERGSAQVDPVELSQRLLDSPRSERAKALARVRALPPSEVGAELRTAILVSIDQESMARRARLRDLLAGAVVVGSDIEEDTFEGDLLEAAVALEDPAFVPVLVDAVGTGLMVARALVRFGMPVVPLVVTAARDQDADPGHRSGAFLTLRFLVEGRSGIPADLRASIGDAAREALSRGDHATVLWTAIDLAWALDDPSLRVILERLASDDSRIRSLGVEDTRFVEMTRQRAAERLEGVAPLPRY